jgi:oligoribonuclease
MPTDTHLLFTDLETTGLDPAHDEIIEAAFLLTTTDLTVLAETEMLVRPSPAALHRLLADDQVTGMHTRSGLLRDLRAADRPVPAADTAHATSLRDAEQRVIDLLHAHSVRAGQLHIAGSGVAAFDKPFLARHMPRLHGLLHYAPIDVGVLRRTWSMWTGRDLVTVNQDKTHRAMDDVRCHLAEATAFRRLFTAAAAGSLPILH